MSQKLSDISSKENIKYVLIKFYDLAQSDDVIGEKFQHINMAGHIDVITNFWDSILFGSNSYHGDPFGKHVPMNLKEEHFKRWVELFTTVVDEHFSGKNAEEMKIRGRTIAQIFQHKLETSN